MEMKLKELAKIWMEDKEKYVKESTAAAYNTLLIKHIYPYFGEMRDVTEDDVQAFIYEKHSDGLCNKYIKDIVMVLGMILSHGGRKGLFPFHPIKVHYPIEERRSGARILTKEEQRRIMGVIRKNPTAMDLGIYIALSSGLRIGEVCALQWKDVNRTEGVISVRKTLQRISVEKDGKRFTKLIMGCPKTGNSCRDIPISDDLLLLMNEIKGNCGQDDYVLSGTSSPLEPRSYRNHYRKFMASMGIDAVRFHGLRHSFATRCIESRCDYKTVSTILGHSSISTTLNLYVHPDMTQKRDCIAQMCRSLGQ